MWSTSTASAVAMASATSSTPTEATATDTAASTTPAPSATTTSSSSGFPSMQSSGAKLSLFGGTSGFQPFGSNSFEFSMTDVAAASEGVGAGSRATATTAMASPASLLRQEGKIAFPTMLGHHFRYMLSSDKLETVFSLESVETKQRWELGFDDAQLKAMGPMGVELPREVVVTFLKEALRGMPPSPHRYELRSDGAQLLFEFTLVFGPGFTPLYRLTLDPVAMSTEELLQAQVRDLKDEVASLRREMSVMRDELCEMRTMARCGCASAAGADARTASGAACAAPAPPPPSGPSTPKPTWFWQPLSHSSPSPAAVGSSSSSSSLPAGSTLNAAAAEFVFGRPAPDATATKGHDASCNSPMTTGAPHTGGSGGVNGPSGLWPSVSVGAIPPPDLFKA